MHKSRRTTVGERCNHNWRGTVSNILLVFILYIVNILLDERDSEWPPLNGGGGPCVPCVPCVPCLREEGHVGVALQGRGGCRHTDFWEMPEVAVGRTNPDLPDSVTPGVTEGGASAAGDIAVIDARRGGRAAAGSAGSWEARRGWESWGPREKRGRSDEGSALFPWIYGAGLDLRRSRTPTVQTTDKSYWLNWLVEEKNLDCLNTNCWCYPRSETASPDFQCFSVAYICLLYLKIQSSWCADT